MDSNVLAHAQAWAQKGLRVFPVAPGKKAPPLLKEFYNHATTDPDEINRMFDDRDVNIGCATGSGTLVLDIDDPKDGRKRFEDLGGSFDTLVVSSPSGGYHVYYQGPDCSQRPLATKIDVRSRHGYVLAPGSKVDGKPYTVLNDSPLSTISSQLHARLSHPPEKPKAKSLVSAPETPSRADDPGAITAARLWLEGVLGAREGARGDDYTYRICANLTHNFGLSVLGAYSLLLSDWNPRCSPPWSPPELYRKVLNGYRYGVTLHHPSPVADIAPTSLSIAKPKSIEKIKPREWVMGDVLHRKQLTLLAGQGGIGKSLLSLTIAAYLAVGKSIGQWAVERPTASVLYNMEDDLDEQSKRLWAICQLAQLDYEEVKRKIHIVQGQMTIASPSANGVKTNIEDLAFLADAAAQYGAGLIYLDPLVEIHDCDEQSNGQMRSLFAALRTFAWEANVALLISHHTTKMAQSVNKSLDVTAVRGAGAITNSCRLVLLALELSEDEKMIAHGLDGFKVLVSKTNYGVRNRAVYFRKQSFSLPMGGAVGVITPA